ncbi:BtpA/SgcQ family protein [Actinomadura montaniterrae]|uniref:BtpA/SgcQ family protein n=1 Tax=Actinomadura montaniterrae TaxID=1803903 RepID=A0A6L3W7W6_9ACTN|nr:BtpA/SgcQ family protein [Actinomadura montaniterrae]KAB2387911.1 BtpA/SgcQ family protein [Actinomadura montaniterrae]HEU5029069.1 BtpA/SgcQ family protein [Spirillospora sp.]
MVRATGSERALGVFPPKPNAVEELFGTPKVVIGAVHLPPLPGSPHYEGVPLDEICAFAIEEARAYLDGGAHGVIVENHWDIPFLKPGEHGYETAAAMAVVTDRVRHATAGRVGVSVLSNAAECSIASAWSGGAGFVRVNQWANAYVANEGIIEGQAAHATRYRSRIGANPVKIFADVHVKHGAHAIVADRTLAEQTEDAEFFGADVLIATGSRTGDAAALDEVEGIAAHTTLPVVIGSGISAGNVGELLPACDGVIVASSVKDNGRWWGRVDAAKVRELTAAAAKAGVVLP